jgi:hypothetical protein
VRMLLANLSCIAVTQVLCTQNTGFDWLCMHSTLPGRSDRRVDKPQDVQLAVDGNVAALVRHGAYDLHAMLRFVQLWLSSASLEDVHARVEANIAVRRLRFGYFITPMQLVLAYTHTHSLSMVITYTQYAGSTRMAGQ